MASGDTHYLRSCPECGLPVEIVLTWADDAVLGWVVKDISLAHMGG